VVETPPLTKNKWTLTQRAFDLLLAQLDADRQQAGSKYEHLRRKLMKFFEWRGCIFLEDLADETLNRLAMNLEAGETIDHFEAYCVGIARHVFLESLRARRQQEALNMLPSSSPAPSDESDRRWECLERCVRQLPPDSLQLIVQYCQENEGSRIKARRDLAAQLGIPMNALRIRAHRIRVQLESCVQQCMKRFEDRETNHQLFHSEVRERES
jgi:DNA-directed RNA polymerase specialized sigma24 family protein